MGVQIGEIDRRQRKAIWPSQHGTKLFYIVFI